MSMKIRVIKHCTISQIVFLIIDVNSVVKLQLGCLTAVHINVCINMYVMKFSTTKNHRCIVLFSVVFYRYIISVIYSVVPHEKVGLMAN